MVDLEPAAELIKGLEDHVALQPPLPILLGMFEKMIVALANSAHVAAA